MNHCTTGHEDSVGTALIKEALEEAYEAGAKDATATTDALKVISFPHGSGESYTTEVEETAYKLWVNLVDVLKVNV